jgi:glyoxylase-like metal-dependent hydrolase (beta-lactamase superfamily II)
VLQKGEARAAIRLLGEAQLRIGDLPENCLEASAPSVPLDEESRKIANKKWIHGAPDCSQPSAREPKYDLLEVNPGYFIIRQNKCITFEAPFLYLMIGETGAFLHDTGDSHSAIDFPLRELIDKLLAKKEKELGRPLHLTVGHGHAHGDHTKGDRFFVDRPNTTVVGLRPVDVAKAYGIKNWPNDIGTLDLGGRKMSVIPIPGHEPSSVAFYDHATGDLLTGDSLYPGNIFLSKSQWPTFRGSVARLKEFSRTHPIRNILGSHVEMKNSPGEVYPYRTLYQPEEHPLPLYQQHLDELHTILQGEASGHVQPSFAIPL